MASCWHRACFSPTSSSPDASVGKASMLTVGNTAFTGVPLTGDWPNREASSKALFAIDLLSAAAHAFRFSAKLVDWVHALATCSARVRMAVSSWLLQCTLSVSFSPAVRTCRKLVRGILAITRSNALSKPTPDGPSARTKIQSFSNFRSSISSTAFSRSSGEIFCSCCASTVRTWSDSEVSISLCSAKMPILPVRSLLNSLKCLHTRFTSSRPLDLSSCV
mmetsp:Transcript_1637/g.3386  ORF Transcript_1637/g.3386 Transcript_1637/m.3386 type:complete len:220 (-) Transcript_1637:393-1052(-)